MEATHLPDGAEALVCVVIQHIGLWYQFSCDIHDVDFHVTHSEQTHLVFDETRLSLDEDQCHS